MTESIKNWQRFSQVLIETNELDPTYSVIVALNKTKSRRWMGHFLMTFLLYYDMGQAIRVADNFEADVDRPWSYWGWLQFMAANEPQFMRRGAARRHMRGENERKALYNLASFGLEPWELVVDMYPRLGGFPSYTELYQNMTGRFFGTQFGPYFIWKLYDIFNICLDMPISLNLVEALKYMPDEPRKNAMAFFPNLSFRQVLLVMTAEVAKLPHPVREGYCGYAEVETILCALKGYFGTKSHWVGEDIASRWNELKDYPEVQKLLPPLLARGVFECEEVGPL
jgi:hypothetical protein